MMTSENKTGACCIVGLNRGPMSDNLACVGCRLTIMIMLCLAIIIMSQPTAACNATSMQHSDTHLRGWLVEFQGGIFF